MSKGSTGKCGEIPTRNHKAVNFALSGRASETTSSSIKSKEQKNFGSITQKMELLEHAESQKQAGGEQTHH